jgi:exopolysaccharide biosynthesis protein
MPSKNPFLTFRDIETDKMIGINIHNITSFKEGKGQREEPYVLVLCVDDRYGRKIDISFKEFKALLRDWYGRSA